jgi:GDP-4-dehydro-6-deoxy-D-mannose reductase
MRYLITGASGFVAGHLIEAIISHDAQAEITGIDIHKPDYYFFDEERKQRVRFMKIDMLDFDALKKALDISRPRYIIHLASFSSVAYSWQYPTESFKNNSNIFLNLLEAIRFFNSNTRILAIGSSEQYGLFSPSFH